MITRLDAPAICKAYRAGKTSRELAREHRCHKNHILRVLRNYKVKVRPSGSMKGKPKEYLRKPRPISADAKTRAATAKLVRRWQEHEPAGRYV